MNLPSNENLRTLIEKPHGWCISIYMPTHRSFPEMKQDPIRLKNLLRGAGEKLKAAGLRPPDVKKLLEPAKALIKDKLFWQFQADGLAVFVSSDLFYHYRVPLTFKSLVVVTDRFHIKPLLPLFGHRGPFYILALSQNEVKFFQCTRFSVREMEMGNAPRSLSEALKYDDPEEQLQFHTGTPAAGGERAAMFHGQGAGKDDAKDKILRFFQQLDEGLHTVLGKETAPLVLAGVDYLFPIYREANSYPHLVERGIVGNPEGSKAEDLHQQAWEITEPHFLKAQGDGITKYKQFAGSDRSSKNLTEIVPAAYAGKVDILFVAVGVQQWGVVDPDSHTVHLHDEPEPGDEDLLDLAAVRTYLSGGTVYALKPDEMPDETRLAAIFRY